MRSGFWIGRYTYSALTKQLKLLTNNAFASVLKLYLPARIDVSARLKHTALNYGNACAVHAANTQLPYSFFMVTFKGRWTR